MQKTLRWAVIASIFLMSACSQSDKREADAKAAEAREKTKQALEHAKADLHKANQNLQQAMNGENSNAQAGAKLDHAEEIAKQKTAQAGREIDRAALIARIKAKLAKDVGLSTVSNVEVDTSGHVVTLRGTVSSADQKHAAERAVSQVDGVTQVVDDLTVE